MFYYQDSRCRKFENESPNSFIFINSKEIKVHKEVCKTISSKLNNIFSKINEPSREELVFYIEDLSNFNEFNLLENLFRGKKIEITENNIKFYIRISEYFEIESLSLLLNYLILDQNIIAKYFIQDQNIDLFYNLEENILLISEPNNIQESAKKCLDILKIIGVKEFLKTFFNICQKSPSISLENIIDFLDNLQKLNDSILDNIINISKEVFKFGNYEEHKNLAFILHQLYQKNYITKEDLSIIFNSKYPFIFIDVFGKEYYDLNKYSLSKEEKIFLEEGNFEIHQKGISSHHSQDPLLCAIREDNLDLLQNILMQKEKIDIQNQIIQSEYEDLDIFQHNKCSLIDYCAFFGSRNCLNYFLANETNYDYKRCIIYAIAGNSKDIISTLLPKISPNRINEIETFIKVSIEYHQQTIFEWLITSYYNQYNGDFLDISIENYNFHALKFLLQYGFSLFDYFISTIYINNSYFLQKSIEVMKLLHKENCINFMRYYFNVLTLNS